MDISLSLRTSRRMDLQPGMTFGSVLNHILPYLNSEQKIVDCLCCHSVLTHYVVQYYVEHESIHDLNGSVHTIMLTWLTVNGRDLLA